MTAKKNPMLSWVTMIALFSMFVSALWSTNAAAVKAEAAQSEANLTQIVGLGDSITYGYEPGMFNDKREQLQPAFGYMERLQVQALYHGRNEMVNYAIPGLTSEGLKKYLEAIEAGKSVQVYDIQADLEQLRIPNLKLDGAAIKEKISQADIIPMTVGGNDVLHLIKGSSGNLDDTFFNGITDMLAAYKDNTIAALDLLHKLNPDVVVVLADQYQPFHKLHVGEQTYVKLQEMAAIYAKTTSQIIEDAKAKGMDIKLASVEKLFAGQEGAMTHVTAGDIHPKQVGYEAIAKVYADAVWGEYRSIQAPAEGEPMNIVVKGVQLNSPYKPVLRKGQNFLAIRDVTDAIGAVAKYNNKTGETTITKGDNVVVLKVGSAAVTVNGKKIEASSEVFLQQVGKESKTYVPLSVIGEGLGLDVKYVSKYRTVFINS